MLCPPQHLPEGHRLGYSQRAMDKLTLIIFLLFIASSAIAFFLWQRIAKVEDNLTSLQASKDEKQAELETTRKDAKRRREEAQSLRDDLQSTKAKLKKIQKKEQEHKVGDKKTKAKKETPSQVGAVVRVSNEEVDARHERQIEALREQIVELESDVQQHKDREAKLKADTEKAAKALKLNSAKDIDELDADALKTQIEALKRAAAESEGELKRSLKRAKADARTHERRASTNHQLYQVSKGQLSLIEDRLARLKLKYEGATDPAKLIKEKPAVEEVKAAEVETKAEETETKAEEAEVRAEEVGTKAKEAEVKAEEAEVKAEEVETKAEEAEVKAEESDVAEPDAAAASVSSEDKPSAEA